MTEHKSYKTLVDVLQERAGSDKTITFIDGQDQHQTVGFTQMMQRARQRLATFQAAGVECGSHMIIQSGDNALFLEGFWACLLGGIVAVPVAGGNTSEHRQKLFRIARTLENAALYVDENNLRRLQQFADEHDLSAEFDTLKARTCAIEDNPGDAANAIIAAPDKHDAAFIQFSSGSTSTPKGIVLTHNNLITNLGQIINGCAMVPEDHFLSWMPLTHDMGLIGFHLTPLFCNSSHSLIPTDVFVRRPAVWLTEAQRMQASILCSPNFGYQHLLKSFKPNRHADLDLSCVRALFNGAEPISVALCEEFMQTMTAFSLDPDCMFPVYGLAEASLAVTFPPMDKRFTTVMLDRSSLSLGETVSIVADDGDGVRFVSVGQPLAGVEVSIMDDQNKPFAQNVTGRICIRGNNVTAGYFREPELNAAMIDPQGWLDTGDLGFMHDGQLYITGRAKDIIFINGQNVYPHDLEEILIQSETVQRGKLAIASHKQANEPEEKLLVFVLHRSELADLEPLARDITRTLGAEAGVRVDAVVAVPRIPKTTSGKVQRYQLARDFAAGEYQVLQQAADDTGASEAQENASMDTAAASSDEASLSTAETLLMMCNTHVEGMTVAPDDNLFELGISSLTLAEIHASIDDIWPDKVDITDLFDYPTVTELATFLDGRG